MPRIASEVFAGAELQRIDEHGHDDDIVLCGGPADEREVAFVQRPHRGNDAHTLSLLLKPSRDSRHPAG